MHTRCEGIVYVPEDHVVEERYECNKCRLGENGSMWLKSLLNDGVKKIKNKSTEILRRLTEIKIQIEKKETEDSMCGLRQIKLKESLKVLKLDPAVYHGGDFEGKAIQTMLDCVRDEKFVILQCVSYKKEVYLKFKRALKTLREVSDLFKSKIEHFNDDQIKSVKEICKNWGKKLVS